ncbi:hypothetical protein WOLCODRAFT_88916 [Wolfiporia cocos MD-104 SS10]|uniref:Autophagy-related protein 29 n=1 Tax=Wolfiporia cocos (strain MD-104) TaxID=742152 RepID=A0A2H3JSZ8_WOLCO|nr:hypothetical protein WOLCODRAFT_88916 [Wolfiporia cocos MD-104 SS10]
MAPAASVRVIVRLPYNRPENSLPDPPRVEWNAEKEHILWEVIAKSRAIEGAGTDWKGLAAHLQVPLPYLLHRAQTRYEEDLRGLQGIRGALSPPVAFPSAPTLSQQPHSAHPSSANANEYFSRVSEVASRRLSTSTPTRPLGVRARLSSLGQNSSIRSRRGSMVRNPSQRSVTGAHISSVLTNGHGATATPPRPSKKVSSSSTLTLQGPRRSRVSPHRPLSPTSSHTASEEGSRDGNGIVGDDEESDESEEEEEAGREEEERRAEEQKELDEKLRKLQLMMTRDTLGLVTSVSKDKGKVQAKDRGRARPLSTSSASVSSAQGRTSKSQQSLSSLSVSSRSPPGSTPSSPPNTHPTMRWRSHPDSRAHYMRTYEESVSPTPSSPRLASPIPRHLSPPGKSSSPPVVFHGKAQGQVRAGPIGTSGRKGDTAQTLNMDGRVSSQGSEASSFSDLSDASLSASALESAMSSNMRVGGSRHSSFVARSMLNGRRSAR